MSDEVNRRGWLDSVLSDIIHFVCCVGFLFHNIFGCYFSSLSAHHYSILEKKTP